MTRNQCLSGFAAMLASVALFSCRPQAPQSAATGDAATRVYVPPGKYDEFYDVVSGGFNGQLSIYGIPSGRLIKIIPVFSVFPENGYGYSEESKAMLNTSHGFVPWDDLHHVAISTTKGEHDGRWVFANGNNTPRVARVSLKNFKTEEILEVPNSGGNHSSPFITENTEYVIAGTRFSIPMHGKDVPISSYKQNFKGSISFIKVDPQTGHMSIAFQLRTPGFNFDLSRAGKGPSHGWFFFSTYNTEQAYTLLEVNASQRDKDYIMAVNWKKAEEYIAQGKGRKERSQYAHNLYDEATHTSTSTMMNEELTILDIEEFPDMVYFIPCPKSPHGCDVDPTGEYIVGSGKLAATMPVFSFTKFQNAIANKEFEGDFNGIHVMKYESVLHGEVPKPGLGPLHTEFDNNGNAYTSMFVSSEIVKWSLKTLEVLDRIPTYYSIGHLSVMGGPTAKPYGKYMVAYNKITKDRYLPTGPELAQAAQLYDISGDKMRLLLDFPTVGEPHYAEAIPASMIQQNSLKFYKLEENNHPYASKGEGQTSVERKGNEVHVKMTAIRSHLTPDNIEGVRVGDDVFFHVTNLEQDWDVPHGFAIKGANTAEILVMPGETQTLKWKATEVGVIPFYCTDFCSALHQEMSGYIRVSPAGSKTPIKFSTGVIEDVENNSTEK